MKRVLVTGANGFIGRPCLPLLLQAGFEVHAVSSAQSPQNKDSNAVHWHQADLLDHAALPSLLGAVAPTHLLHLAWYTEPSKYWTSLDNARWLSAGIDLLLAFIRGGGRKAVVAGSCAEYDWRYGYCTENLTPLAPHTFYGRCKLSLLEAARALELRGDLDLAWGRLFFLYGPGERKERLVPSVLRSILSGEKARCTSGTQVRDFLYVDDAARAFVSLLGNNVAGEFNIGSGTPLRISDLVTRAGERLGHPELVGLGAVPAPKPQDNPSLLLADNRKLLSLGWKPEIDIAAGLERCIDYWRTPP